MTYDWQSISNIIFSETEAVIHWNETLLGLTKFDRNSYLVV